MSFDHGILNVPLAKRGNINSQLDTYKKQLAASRRADERKRAAELKPMRLEAKALVEGLTDERLAVLAAKCKLTPAEARKKLRSMAHWSPVVVIDSLKPKAEA